MKIRSNEENLQKKLLKLAIRGRVLDPNIEPETKAEICEVFKNKHPKPFIEEAINELVSESVLKEE